MEYISLCFTIAFALILAFEKKVPRFLFFILVGLSVLGQIVFGFLSIHQHNTETGSLNSQIAAERKSNGRLTSAILILQQKIDTIKSELPKVGVKIADSSYHLAKEINIETINGDFVGHDKRIYNEK